jgi:sirohydrochlorin ferrochelatase
MHGLVLIAHGSRRQASNQEVMDLNSRLQRSASDRFQLYETGFLEIASPSIPEAIESCIHRGATYITVVPYFLSAGRHVVEDIPGIIEPLAHKHKTVTIHITEHVGASDSMVELILESAIYSPGTATNNERKQA